MTRDGVPKVDEDDDDDDDQKVPTSNNKPRNNGHMRDTLIVLDVWAQRAILFCMIGFG